MTIKERTLRTLAVIRTKPDKYHNILELPLHAGTVSESYFMSYLGILIQSILIVNDSIFQVNKDNYHEYEECVRVFRENGIAYNREMPRTVYMKFLEFLEIDLPLSIIKDFVKEYQLKLFGDFLWMERSTKEYISDFDDPRLLNKLNLIWSTPFPPFLVYRYRSDILEKLGGTLNE